MIFTYEEGGRRQREVRAHVTYIQISSPVLLAFTKESAPSEPPSSTGETFDRRQMRRQDRPAYDN